jgi:hypothetical protein
VVINFSGITICFISYSSKDVKIVEAIENHFLQNGFDDNVWRDKRKIESDWSREIAIALTKSDIVLRIWSEYSSKSEWG